MSETGDQRRARLETVLAQLDAAGTSAFLDLCELLVLLSQRTDGSITWKHPRVLVRIKHRKPVKP